MIARLTADGWKEIAAMPDTPRLSTLPQLSGRPFLTDGGLETTLLFHEGLELPCFAAIALMRDERGRDHLRRYYERYVAIARKADAGFILESPTWRASSDWAAPLGLSPEQLDGLNRDAIMLMHEIRRAHERPDFPMVVSGCVGPRGDGYRPDRHMPAPDSEDYHARQVGVLQAAGADMIAAVTMTSAEEATGIVLAARRIGIAAAVSFTLETDGRLPTEQALGDAIVQVDDATDGWPAYYMVNCAHPAHFAPVLTDGGEWVSRVRGLRANASQLSHAELDASTDLDVGDPAQLASEHRSLLTRLPHINVLGGCCGTDHRHVEAIAAACLNVAATH
jgi:S-methylmethionine-dependent homocysteine/selenocysteine methylase